MARPRPELLIAAIVLLAGCAQDSPPQCDGAGFLITNVRIADGTGGAIENGDVRVTGDRIAAVGDLAACEGEMIIDGQEQVLAPGSRLEPEVIN